jgi:hypothetical protein
MVCKEAKYEPLNAYRLQLSSRRCYSQAPTQYLGKMYFSQGSRLIRSSAYAPVIRLYLFRTLPRYLYLPHTTEARTFFTQSRVYKTSFGSSIRLFLQKSLIYVTPIYLQYSMTMRRKF